MKRRRRKGGKKLAPGRERGLAFADIARTKAIRHTKERVAARRIRRRVQVEEEERAPADAVLGVRNALRDRAVGREDGRRESGSVEKVSAAPPGRRTG